MSRLNEMFKGLMFLQGHFTHAEDVDPVSAPLGNRAASDRWFARTRVDATAIKSPAERQLGASLALLHQVRLLGVRTPERLAQAPTPAPRRDVDALGECAHC